MQTLNTVCALHLALIRLIGGADLAAAACSLTQLRQGQVSAWHEYRVLKRKRKKAILFCILPKFTGGVLLILILKINPWHDWPVLWSLNGSSLQLDWPALVQPVACPQEALCVSVASLQWAWLPEWHCSVTWLWTLPHYLQQTQQAFQETYNSIFKFFIQSTPCWSKAAKYVFAGRWYTSRNDEDMN